LFFKEDILLDLLGLVHQYGFQHLENSLSIYLKSILSLKNVCTIYDTACLFTLNNLKQHSAQFIDNYANDIIKTNEFLTLSPVSSAFLLSLNI
jgi:BTB/POZ domain-containing protein 9